MSSVLWCSRKVISYAQITFIHDRSASDLVSCYPKNKNLIHFHEMLQSPEFRGVGNFNLIPFLMVLLKSSLAFEAGRETVWKFKNRGKMLCYVSCVSGLSFYIFNGVPVKMMYFEMSSHQYI